MASDVVVDLEGGGNPVLQENDPPVNGTTSEKRLTKVEQAKHEVLSAFGNCPFNSLVVKKECFKSKLNATAKNAASQKDSIRRLTRMERARNEANEAFKNISLGQKRKASVVDEKTGTHPVTDNAKKRLTRLERCKLEAQQAFGNVPLSTLTAGNVEKEKVMKGKRISTSKGRQNRKSTSRRRSSVKTRRRSSVMKRRRSSTKGSQLAKVQTSQSEALKSFGGQSLENVWKNSKASSPVVEGVAVTAVTHLKNATSVGTRPLTRLEKAHIESLQSFNGHAFEDVIKTSTRKMARYLTPVKHQGTNTELEVNHTRDTPSQTENSYCKQHPRPNNAFYSNLRDNSFCDRGMLLESSKMVVSTARSLDTPSPSS